MSTFADKLVRDFRDAACGRTLALLTLRSDFKQNKVAAPTDADASVESEPDDPPLRISFALCSMLIVLGAAVAVASLMLVRWCYETDYETDKRELDKKHDEKDDEEDDEHEEEDGGDEHSPTTVKSNYFLTLGDVDTDTDSDDD